MIHELRKEVLRMLKSGTETDNIYDLLVQYKQTGMDKDTMYNVLESIRAEMRELGEEELEDEIMDYMDCVVGFCSPRSDLYLETRYGQPVMLSVKHVTRFKCKFDISYIKFAGGMIEISVNNMSDICEAPCRWYLSKGCGMPPLSVHIDDYNGRIVSISAFKTKSMTPMPFVPPVISQNRDVIVDRSIFKKANGGTFGFKGYSLFKHEGNLVCLFEDEQEPVKSYRNGRFELLIDNCNQIVGFSICDLTEEEITMLNSLEEGQ